MDNRSIKKAVGTGMTVGGLIEDLRGYPSRMPVGMCVGPISDLLVVSIYTSKTQMIDGKPSLWFDLQEQKP